MPYCTVVNCDFLFDLGSCRGYSLGLMLWFCEVGKIALPEDYLLHTRKR